MAARLSWSDERRKEFSDAVRKSWTTATRRARSQAMKKRWQTLAYRKQQSQSRRAAWKAASEERRERNRRDFTKLRNTPEFCDKRRNGMQQFLDSAWVNLDPKHEEYRQRVRKNAAGIFRRIWKDPDLRQRMLEKNPTLTRWYTEEKIVRGWLRRMKLYRTGSKSRERRGFVPHAWLPTKGSGFTFTGDFVDYNYGLIIHVDGWHHFFHKDRREKDQRNDRWCVRNGWSFIRLSDTDINNRPLWCQWMIRLLTKGRVVPLYMPSSA